MNTTPTPARTSPTFVTLALLAVALVVTGCSPSRPPRGTVSGTVTVNGKPLTGGLIALNYAEGNPSKYVINVKPDGTFSTTDAPPGTAKVTVQSIPGGAGGPGAGMPADMNKEMEGKFKDKGYPIKASDIPTPGAPMAVPAKYQDAKTTPITWQIDAATNETRNLELTN